jgi:hypothetical protein
MIPHRALVDHFATVDAFDDWSLISGPTAQVEPPAIVIRAETPWMVPSGYCHDEQRYVAVGVVQSATPGDGEQMLYTMGLRVMDNLLPGWEFVGMDAPVVDESTGVAYLAAGIHLRYKNNDLEDES